MAHTAQHNQNNKKYLQPSIFTLKSNPWGDIKISPLSDRDIAFINSKITRFSNNAQWGLKYL